MRNSIWVCFKLVGGAWLPQYFLTTKEEPVNDDPDIKFVKYVPAIPSTKRKKDL